MSYRITCYTLFDIAQTGVINRNKPSADEDPDQWRYKRNVQCNFDTILQAISLRSQPDVVRLPQKKKIKFQEFTNFGFLFEQSETTEQNCWSFDFDVQHPSVFQDGMTELGALYTDCQGVPMIKVGTEWEKLPDFLDATDELRNIYFEVIGNDN